MLATVTGKPAGGHPYAAAITFVLSVLLLVPAAPAQAPPAPPSDKPQPQSAEHKISPAEADDLFRSVDDILAFASKDTTLPIHDKVKRRLTSRDEVVAYIQKHMNEDEDAQRLRRSELVLKKFGLLPRDFNLETFLLTLLREQVAGYYDPATKTVNLLDWIDPEQQRPVLAHELTHALQDQSFGLQKWIKAVDVDIDNKKQPTPEDLDKDDAATARQAVIEGQAMAALVDYMLAPTGQSLLDSPQIVEALKQGMLVGTADTIQFHNAPLYIKEALTFPYRYGLDFVTELLTRGGKQKAFADPFKYPPVSTRQIMEPQTYLSGEKLPTMQLPDFERDFKNYERFDIGGIGEFDVAVLIDQYAGADASKRLYPQWRGGYYYAATPKGNPLSPLALLYVSRWATPASAQEFAGIYSKSLAVRYRRAQEVRPQATSRDLSAPAVAAPPFLDTRMWLTEEGPVVISVHGDTLLITESFDETTARRIEQELFPKLAVTGR